MDDRDAVVDRLRSAGVESTLGTYAMHAHPAFAHLGWHPGDLPESLDRQDRSLTLPLLPRMRSDDVEAVVSALARAIEGRRG